MYPLVLLLALPLVLFTLASDPMVQTFLARFAGSYLTQKLNTEIKIDALKITPFFNVKLEGLLVKDLNQDTLLHAAVFRAGISERNFRRSTLKFNHIVLEGASIGFFKANNDTLMNLDRILENIRERESEDDRQGLNMNFRIRSLDVYDTRFRYHDANKEEISPGMDYDDLDILVEMAELGEIFIESDTINLVVYNLAASEKSGFRINRLSGQFNVSPAFLHASELMLKTPRSDLSLDFSFIYNDWNDYIDFIEKVNIESHMRPSVLNLGDIGFFAGPLLIMDNEIRLGGDFTGTVENLKAKGLRFAYKNAWFNGDITLFGLPNIQETFVNLDIREMEFSTSDIKSFALPGEVRYMEISPTLDKFGTIGVSGNFTGFFNDFVANGVFRTGLGEFKTDVNLQPEESGRIKYQGDLSANNFNIGKLLGLEQYLGKMNLKAYLDGQGVTGETAIIGMNGSVDSLEFMGNNFNKVQIAGILGGQRFNGYVNIYDELLKLDFNGNIDFNRDIPIVDFAADIDEARLYDLNILKRDPDALFSSQIWCSFVGKEMDGIEGRLNIDSIYYTEGEKQIFIEHLTMLALKKGSYQREISLRSDVLDAGISGTYRYTDLYPALMAMLNEHISLDYLSINQPDSISIGQDYSFDVLINNADELTSVFLQELRLSPNTSITGSVNSAMGQVVLTGISDEIIYGGLRFDNWSFGLRRSPESLELNSQINRFVFKGAENEDDMELGIDNLLLKAYAHQDSLDCIIRWTDQEKEGKNKGNLAANMVFADTILQFARIREARMFIEDSLWTIDPGNVIIHDSGTIVLKDLKFKGEKQSLSLHGKISKNITDTLSVEFREWEFSNFDLLVNNEKMDLDGEINGDLKFSALLDTVHFESDLQINDLMLNDIAFGNATVNTSWHPVKQSIEVDAEAIYQGNVSTSKTLDIKGAYYPKNKKQNFDIKIALENFKIKAFKPFVAGVFSDVRGVASGMLYLRGISSKPSLTGNLKLMRTGLGIGYINTLYSFANEIQFEETSINFKDITIYDSLGNTGLINGAIKHNYLKDFELDLNILANNLICLNTNKYQNDIFYGNAFASGLVEITGPFDNISLEVTAKTEKGTDVFVPLSSSSEIDQHDYIIFYDPDADTTSLQGPVQTREKSGLDLLLDLDVTSDAEIQIFLPDQMGNINSRGMGKVKMGVDPEGKFSINGTYSITNGNFLFQIQNIIRKRFEILEGGKITFSGDPYNAELNIRGLYRLKTTIAGLSTTLDAMYAGERVNVDCIIGLRGRLANPDINFSIRFPNLAQEAKYNIYSVLDTNDQGAMNQQMISLLILGSFSNTAGAGNLGASSFNLISNQLSNWLSQISRDFDVGINYIPGDEINQDEIAVALSTQLFNDRLIVDGNVGVGGQNSQSSSQNASNIVGDVNIEYKLRPDGRIRLRAFNRSNNIYTFENIAPYTQGVGIFYRKEFNSFRDLFGLGRSNNKKKLPDE